MKFAKITTLAFCAFALLTGCKQQEAKQETVREELVKTTVLRKTEVARVLDLSTTLEGYQTMNIAPSLTGRIEHIYVEVGSKVSAGSDLVRMDQNQYNNTKLTFTNLKREIARMEALKESGSISQQAYDQTKLGYDQAKESLKFLETNTYVKARFPGVISAKNYEDGELYSGQPILILTQINVLKAYINIPENYFPLIKQGMNVEITSEIYPGKTFPATVEIVHPTVDAASHTFKVKLRIPNSAELLRPGMYVSTSLALGKAEAMVVPYQSVQKLIGSNERYVYINNGGYAKRIFVKLGQRFDDRIEVIADEIKEGVEIITTGAERLVDGVKLKFN